MAEAKRKCFSDKMVLANSRPKLIWEILNDVLGRKSRSSDVKQCIGENSNSEIISGTNTLLRNSTIALLILVTHMEEIYQIILHLTIT